MYYSVRTEHNYAEIYITSIDLAHKPQLLSRHRAGKMGEAQIYWNVDETTASSKQDSTTDQQPDKGHNVVWVQNSFFGGVNYVAKKLTGYISIRCSPKKHISYHKAGKK